MGRDGFWWFQGVVEDRQDPLKLGRVKVRILGCHTPDKTFILSEDLLWAYIIQPVTSLAMNGLGISPLGPVPGTWVFGFFRDGTDMQEPVIMGTFAGVPQTAPDNTKGFNDPRDYETPEKLATAPRKIQTRVYPTDGSGAKLTPEPAAVPYPRNVHPLGCVVGESDTNRIARAEKINDTIIQVISDNTDENVPIAFGGSWSEPEPWYEGEYPYVHVQESESGHISVKDDTPKLEGTLEWDRTGTFKQVQTDGSEVHKIVMDNYTVVLRKNEIHVMNDQDEYCQQECNLLVGGRWNVEAVGNINIFTHSGTYIHSVGDTNIKADGNVNIGANGNVNVKSKSAVNVTAGTEVDILAANAIKLSAGGKVSVTAGGSIEMIAGGIFAVDAASIHLNDGLAHPDPAGSASDPTLPKQ